MPVGDGVALAAVLVTVAVALFVGRGVGEGPAVWVGPVVCVAADAAVGNGVVVSTVEAGSGMVNTSPTLI